MANYCDYEIHVKGSKKAALMVYAAMPIFDYKCIMDERESGDDYIVEFTGNCKWGLDYGCEPAETEIDLDLVDEDDFDEDCGEDYIYISLQEKSKMLHCEIQAHAWSEEAGFDGFEHYIDGKEIRCDYVLWSGSEDIEWDKDSYPTYEEFCAEYGIDPEEIHESEFEEVTEDYFVYHIEADDGVDFSFSF